jgi:hypothetical protein
LFVPLPYQFLINKKNENKRIENGLVGRSDGVELRIYRAGE